MALAFAAASHLISTTEWSIAANLAFAGGTTQTTKSRVGVLIDLSAMAAGDQLRIRVYETINGVQTVVHEAWPTGKQPGGYVIPESLLGDGWDITILKVLGTDRTFGWTFHDDDTQALTEIAEGSNSLGAIVRLLTSVLAGKASGFNGASIVFKSLDGTKNRLTAIVDATGRTTITVGDLT